jgi:predicted Rossmann-fold nucleotide-binding protein
MHFMMRARALVAFPGGYGTFDEVFETLCLVQSGKKEPIPVVLVGREFWNRAVDLPFLVSEGMIDEADLDLFAMADSAEEIWNLIADWYASRGRSILE